MRRLSFVFLSAVLAAAGCSPKPAAPPPADTTPATPAPSPADLAKLLPAAEPFEGLTESAFSAKPAQLDKAINDAAASLDQVSAFLPSAAQSDVKTSMQAIGAGKVIDDRAAIALASVEIYRTLVSNAPAAAIPSEVSLLDYAGFRYDADLKAKPARWADTVAAAAFGAEKWATIEARVTDKPLHDKMTKALADMAAAAAAQDGAKAADAARREMDLVDLLEAFFTKAG